jgi:hypothetical protein
MAAIGRGGKVDSYFKNEHFMGMAGSVYLVPNQFQESIFPTITRPKNRLCFVQTLAITFSTLGLHFMSIFLFSMKKGWAALR